MGAFELGSGLRRGIARCMGSREGAIPIYSCSKKEAGATMRLLPRVLGSTPGVDDGESVSGGVKTETARAVADQRELECPE